MIPTLIITVLAFGWLLYETDFMRVKLESWGYQKAQALQSKSEGVKDLTNGITPAPTVSEPENATPYKPSQFEPLDMPETTGNLNIVCKRE